jgi:hypothetical protein
MKKTLDKRRMHVLDYLKLIQYLVHFLEAIHNIWVSADVLFFVFRKDGQKQLYQVESPKTNGAHCQRTRRL